MPKFRIVIAGNTVDRCDHFKTAEAAAIRKLDALRNLKARAKVKRGVDTVATYGWVNGAITRIAPNAPTPTLRLADGSHRTVWRGIDRRAAINKGWDWINATHRDRRSVLRLYAADGAEIAQWRYVGDTAALSYAEDFG